VPPRLLGDESRVRQILFNLVGNAVKFTESGSVSLELTPLQAKGRTVRLLISVVDTGIGIHADQMSELFQPFAQVENSYTRRFQGAGLGLSIVRRLVSLLGGSIDMDSIPGEGTRVHVALPFRLPVEDEAGPAQPREAGKPGSLRILLAEDDWSNAIATRTLLEKLGHDATLTRNGREAVEIAGREKFDVVFMDIQMPVMSGIEATRAIRARKNGPNADIPIIALTAYAMAGDREKFLEAGMNGYLAKPLDLEELRTTLERIVP
jgi:CheY-like chemotaxis protein